MKINLAHIRERSTTGGWIDFAVFDAKATTCGDTGNNNLLVQLTAQARVNGLKIDQSALAYKQGSQIKFFGDKNLVNYLSGNGVPRWTHTVDV